MAKYDNTKFYWLQLKEDFFEDDAIQWLEEQEPNGRDYAYFYLKLCLKSLKSNGILVRQVGNVLIPYDNKKLAELTKMDFDTVTIAMELLKKIGLVKIFDSGEIYLTQLQNLIGSKSIGALKKQQQREIKKIESGQMEDKCPPKIELEYRDRTRNRDIYNIYIPEKIQEKTSKKSYGEFKRVKLTDKEYEKLCSDFTKEEIDKQIVLLDEYIESNNNKNKYTNFNLVLRKSIRENWFKKDFNNSTNKTKSERQYEILKGVYDGTIKVE